MDQHMAHLDDLRPRDLLMSLAKLAGELAGCFADDLDMVIIQVWMSSSSSKTRRPHHASARR